MAQPDETRHLQDWERLVASMPAAVLEGIPLRLWDRTKLHALDLPLREMPVENLRWMLDVPPWAVDGVAFRITPNAVRAHPDRYPDQYRRVMEADLSFPIHVIRHNDRGTILDGVHRLLRASMDGRERISAMVLSDEDYRHILIEGHSTGD